MTTKNKANELNKEYEKAQQDPEYRLHFLDAIDLTPIAKYVCGVIYMKSSDGIYTCADADISANATLIAATRHAILSMLHIPRGRSSICVFPPAFSPQEHPTVEDFLGTIIDHEGFHAMEAFEKPGTIVCPVWSNIADFFTSQHKRSRRRDYYESAEARAIANVLANPAGRAFSPAYLAKVQGMQRMLELMSCV